MQLNVLVDPRWKITRNIKIWIALLIATVLVANYIYVHFIVPAPFFISTDPEMQYMSSSLAIFKGQPYTYIDHPGTPVELIGTALLALTYPAVNLAHQPFVLFHLQHPELFMMLVRGFLTVTSILAVLLLLRYAIPGKAPMDVLAAAGIAISFYALYPLAADSLVHWSHNDFSFPFGTTLLLVVFVMFRNPGRLTKINTILLGLAFGFLVASQLYFVTWIFGAVVGFIVLWVLKARTRAQTLQAIGYTLASTVIGFVLFTLPILGSYRRLISWIYVLTFHQGKYGGGEFGITSPATFLENFKTVIGFGPLLFIAIVVTLVALMLLAIAQRSKLRENAYLWAAACGFSAQLLVTLFLIFKQPANAYLLAVDAIMPLLLTILFTLIGKSTRLACIARSVVTLILVVAFFVNFSMFWTDHSNRVQAIANEDKGIQQFLSNYAASTGRPVGDLSIVWSLPTSSRCFAYWFGSLASLTTNGIFAPEISQLCPNQWAYIGREIVTLDGTKTLKQLRWDVMIVSQTALVRWPQLVNYGKRIDGQSGIVFFLANNPKSVPLTF